MVKCPKCGVKGWENYYPIATLDRDFNDDMLIETNKVECTECHHHYIIREFFKLSFVKSYNVDQRTYVRFCPGRLVKKFTDKKHKKT